MLSNEAIAYRAPGFTQLSHLSWNDAAMRPWRLSLSGTAVMVMSKHGLSLGNTGI